MCNIIFSFVNYSESKLNFPNAQTIKSKVLKNRYKCISNNMYYFYNNKSFCTDKHVKNGFKKFIHHKVFKIICIIS